MSLRKGKVFAVVAVVSAVCLSAVSATADAYVPPGAAPGEAGFSIIDDNFMAGDKASYIFSTIPGTSETQGSIDTICAAYGEANCVETSKQQVQGNLLLGVCVAAEVNCIEGISVYKQTATALPATLEKLVPGPTTPANLSADIPRGATVSVWSAPGVEHAGGTSNYAAYVKLRFHMVSGKSVFEDFTAGVVPVNENSNGMPTPVVTTRPGVANDQHVEIRNSGPSCVYNYDMKCARAQDFAADTRVRMVIRVSNRLTGWLKGRLQNPVITVTPIDNAFNRLTVEANTATVPQLTAAFSQANLPASVDAVFPGIKASLTRGQATMASINASADTAFKLIEATREVKKDKASGLSTSWAFSSLLQAIGPTNNCLADTKRLVGLVTTNSMSYEGTAPQFQNGILNYKVAGLHYLPDGSEASGVYDLVMRSDTARCLYGFTNAPISATISVTSSAGEAKAAVTNFSEKDGWVHFGAYGFTFSQPKISVKLTQKKVTAKPTSILCVSTKNAKLTKKVTAVSPKCPTGYKKK